MPVNKHINFFELEKVCAKQGCPLCRLVRDRAERYLDNMLFEHVSDRGFRAKHRVAGGFCSRHSRNLDSFRDGLAVAILSRDILEDRITAFNNRKAWKPKGSCPVCEEQARIEQEYLSFLMECTGNSKEEEELRRVFTASDGLCAPHYGKLVSMKGKLPTWLADFHRKKFDALMERTLRFIDLSAYGRQAEFRQLSEEDQHVWQEVARTLRGGSAED